MYAYVTDNPTTLNDPSGLSGSCGPNDKSQSNCVVAVAVPDISRKQSAVVRGSYTVTYSISESSKINSNGSTTYTTVTATGTFDKKTNKFESATTETVTVTKELGVGDKGIQVVGSTDSGPQSLTQAQFTNLINTQEQSVAPGGVVRFARATAQDAGAHPAKYALFGAGMITPFMDIPTGVEGLIAGIKSLYSAYELDDEMQGVAGQ